MESIMSSNGEKIFRIQAPEFDVRLSSRELLAFRPIVIDSECNSCEVSVGDTRVTAKIGFDPDGKPLSSKPNEGYLKFQIDWSSDIICGSSHRKIEDYSDYLKSLISEAYQEADIIDLSALCIMPQKKCWVIHVDIAVLSNDGGLLDAICLAIKCALKCFKIPQQFDKARNLHINLDNCPLYVTVYKINTKYIIDADKKEEGCSAARTMSAVLANGLIKCTQRDDEGSLKVPCIIEMIKISSSVGKELHRSLEEYHNLVTAMSMNTHDNAM